MAAMKSSSLTADTTLKSLGGTARLLKLSISNNGTAGVSGWIEVRDGVSSGTLRWRVRFASSDEQNLEIDFPSTEDGFGLPLPDGLRIDITTTTNVEVWALWEG